PALPAPAARAARLALLFGSGGFIYRQDISARYMCQADAVSTILRADAGWRRGRALRPGGAWAIPRAGKRAGEPYSREERGRALLERGREAALAPTESIDTDGRVVAREPKMKPEAPHSYEARAGHRPRRRHPPEWRHVPGGADLVGGARVRNPALGGGGPVHSPAQAHLPPPAVAPQGQRHRPRPPRAGRGEHHGDRPARVRELTGAGADVAVE